MPINCGQDSNLELNSQIKHYFKQFGDAAVNLRITEKILCEIEYRLFSLPPALFDIQFVKDYLQKLKNPPADSSLEDLFQIEFQINQEFQLWRSILEDRNSKIETYHLRRFFDTTPEKFDVAVFVALAFFYRNSPFFQSHLSKFDLVLTRLFTKGKNPNQREALLGREERINHLTDLFNSWDEKPATSGEQSAEIRKAISEFDNFINEGEKLSDFEQLIQSNMFERLRNYKNGLGKLFFEPAVAAVAVECNLSIGNVFSNLLTEANQNLSEKLNAKFDFAGAFHDPSPNAQLHISDILQEIRSEDVKNSEITENKELDHIWDLLGLICGQNFSNNTNRKLNETAEKPEFAGQPSATERLAPFFSTIYSESPDIKALREYTQKSKSLWTIDLNDFLGSTSEAIDKICRDALWVILLTDELCTHELNRPHDISQKTAEELANLVNQTQEIADKLEPFWEVPDASIQNRLLIISNKFLETRLKLERTIVRFSHHHLGRFPVQNPDDRNTEQSPAQEPVPPQLPVVTQKVNRWLIAATFMVAFLSGGAFVISQQFGEMTTLPRDVEEINVEVLPENTHLQNAYRQKSTLFVITKESWNNLSEEEKRASLEKLVNFPAKTKLHTVIVTNGAGKPLGDVSPDGINLAKGL